MTVQIQSPAEPQDILATSCSLGWSAVSSLVLAELTSGNRSRRCPQETSLNRDPGTISGTGTERKDLNERVFHETKQTRGTCKELWSFFILSLSEEDIYSYLFTKLRVTKDITDRVQLFANRCLRAILDIRWPDAISHEDLWKHTNQDKIQQQIRKKKWR